MTEIYVDADACPVKDEIMRVAGRHDVIAHIVSNAWMRLPDSPLIHRVVVDEGPDAADDWIAERIGAGDIAITTAVSKKRPTFWPRPASPSPKTASAPRYRCAT